MSEPQNVQLPEPPPLPALDELVPPWQREAGRKGGLTKAERTARATNRAQRLAVEVLIDRLKRAETNLADAQRAQVIMRRSIDEQVALRSRAEAELQAVRGNLSIMLQVATQVAAAAGRAVTNVDYDQQYRSDTQTVHHVRLAYWLVGNQVPVLHDVSQGEILYGTGREEARFLLTAHGGISADWQRALWAYNWHVDDCDHCGRRANRLPGSGRPR
jgi:hypothetical protein